MKGANDDVNKVERSSSKTRGQEEESSNDTIAPTAEVATKKNIHAPVLPTRYSSRVKKDGIPMMEKAMNRKAAMASTGISSHPNPNNTVVNQVELISKVCGINLGDDIKNRAANISLIQARDEAVEALNKAKNKILLSSDNLQHQTLSSANDGIKEIEDHELQRSIHVDCKKGLNDNLSILSINEDTILEC